MKLLQLKASLVYCSLVRPPFAGLGCVVVKRNGLVLVLRNVGADLFTCIDLSSGMEIFVWWNGTQDEDIFTVVAG